MCVLTKKIFSLPPNNYLTPLGFWQPPFLILLLMKNLICKSVARKVNIADSVSHCKCFRKFLIKNRLYYKNPYATEFPMPKRIDIFTVDQYCCCLTHVSESSSTVEPNGLGISWNLRLAVLSLKTVLRVRMANPLEEIMQTLGGLPDDRPSKEMFIFPD